MEKGPNKNKNIESVKKKLSDENSSELHDTLADNEETMCEKLSRLPQGYWDTINNESESGETISEKHIYEANLSVIEKKFDKNSTEYKVLQALKKQGLRIFINPKTDISYTNKYNIIRGLGPVTEKSKATMMYGDSTSDEEVHMAKLIHEMGHSTLGYNTEHQKIK